MDTGFAYKVKFVDVRLRSPKEARARANAKPGRTCDMPGCQSVGNCRAPVHPDRPSEHYWFCQAHAAEYNKGWDFFAGKSAAEIDAFQRDAVYGWGPTRDSGRGPQAGAFANAASGNRSADPRYWKGADTFGPEFQSFGGTTADRRERPAKRTRSLPVLAARAMDELSLDHDTPKLAVRTRYSELVKRLHPDANRGDRTTEDKLQRVIRAFKVLKAAGLA